VAELEHRYKHHPPHGDQAERYQRVRASILATAVACVELSPASLEQQHALNALDDAMFLFHAAIARHGCAIAKATQRNERTMEPQAYARTATQDPRVPPNPEMFGVHNMAGEAMPRRADPERTRELMMLAQGIAAQVEARVPPGPERCRLRRMVEMFLDE